MRRRQAALGALQAWPGGLQLGGGVNLDNAKQWLDAGASHVIVTSFVFREGRLEEDRLKALVSALAWAPCTLTDALLATHTALDTAAHAQMLLG